MDSKIKYVHIMPQGSKTYDYSIIRMVNDVIKFNSHEHLFILSSKHIYDLCSDYNNVVYELNVFRDKRKLNSYFNQAFVVFLHSNTMSIRDLLKLNKNQKSKILWCVWGHDLYRKNIEKYSRTNIPKQLLKTLYFSIYDRLLKNIKGIGIGFDYDKHEVIKRFGNNMKIYRTPYFSLELKMEYLNSKIDMKSRKKTLRVMIGHSAYSFLNHNKILDEISKFKHEDIVILLVLSYGSKTYKEEVIKYAKRVFNNKIEIINTEMDIVSYLNYLKNVDIAIFDHTHQSALSNIYYLLYLNKKLFLNNEGIIAKSLSSEGLSYSRVSDIQGMSFEEFRDISLDMRGKKFAEMHINSDILIDIWAKTIEELDAQLHLNGGYVI